VCCSRPIPGWKSNKMLPADEQTGPIFCGQVMELLQLSF